MGVPLAPEEPRAGVAGEQRTRILVADPLLIFRSGMRSLLAGHPEFELVEVADADGLERAVGERPSDLALIDLHLPPDGGIAALRLLLETRPIRAVIWSFEPMPETVLEAIQAGSCGYLRKEISPDGLLRALRGLLRGQAPLGRDFAALLVQEVQRFGERERARERASILSTREREVLELVAGGASNRDVAATLYISELTVKRHMQNILRKLRVPSRVAAASFYREAFGSAETAAA
ncbi:MAG TPA: response regulator transcription factor [Gaiellaceae bacterium]